MTQPFERQPKESAKAFAAFSEYLSQGPQRSLAAVAQRLAKSIPLVKRWLARFDWPGRVAAFGAHLATIEREAIEGLAREKGVEWWKLHEEQRLKEWKLRTDYYDLAQEALRRWKADPRRTGSLEGLARVAEVFMKLGRMASGMPTESKEVVGHISGKVSVEWEAVLKKGYGRLKAGGKVIEAEVVDVTAKQPGGQSLLTAAATGTEVKV